MKNLSGRKILLVDDEPFVRDTIKQILRMIAKFIVRDAGDGEAALVALTAFAPDVVLCDICMKPMGGIEFVEKLRKHPDPVVRNTPVIMLTVDDKERTVKDASRLGISGYVLKPTSPSRLRARLQAVLA